MASKDLRAKIRLEGDPKDANAAIKSVDSRFKRLAKTIKGSSLAQIASIAGVLIAFRSLVRGIKAVVDAANIQEDAINALDGALADLGPRAVTISAALQKQAAALQKVSKFGDETIIQAQALIASFVKEEDQIKAATIATLDLAEAKGFSLVSAADLISKTLGSSTNALTRYGIEVVGAVGSTERLASLTTNIAKVFGGRAAKAAETFGGKIKQLKDVIGDMQEEIGFAITKNQDLIDALDDMKDEVVELTPEFAKLAEEVVGFTIGSLNAALRSREFLATLNPLSNAMVGLVDTTGLAARAIKAMGIEGTLLETILFGVNLRAARSKVAFEEMAKASDDVTLQLAKQVKETGKVTDELEDLEKAAEESADAMIKLGEALDIVTSTELEKEITDIQAALERVREATGGFGDEFIRAERIAGEKIEKLEVRIFSLSNGLGDVKEAAEEAADTFDDLGLSSDRTAEKIDGMTTALRGQATQANSTSRAITALSAVSEQLALAQARTDLAATQAARNRITGVSSQAGEVGAFTGLPIGVGTRQTFRVNPDGSLTRIN